jgi:thiamine biosynthesis lipoprotein
MHGARAVLLATALALPACGPPAEQQAHRHEFTAFGSIASIAIAGTGQPEAAAAAAAVERLWSRLGHDWYAYGSDGELVRVNRALALGEPAMLGEELAPVVARALALREASGGLFEPAVAPLVSLWGFSRADEPGSEPPGPGAVAALLPLPGFQLEDRLLVPDAPAGLDLGGIAKGSALAAAAAELATLGIDNALINAGNSSVLALGRPGQRGWRVAIAHPLRNALIGVVELAPGEALATSGTTERFFIHGGERYHHVLDPRSGQPATGVASVTVLSADPELADAASTALVVAGRQGFDALLAALQLEQALLVTATGEVVLTPALAARLGRGTGPDL